MNKAVLDLTVKPSATPSEAEIAAWQHLPRDQQLQHMRDELAHPDCKKDSHATMEDIRAEGLALANQLRNA